MTVKKARLAIQKIFCWHCGDALFSADIKKLLWIAFCAFRISFNLFLCQGVSVYVGLSACFAIRLPPSILTAVQWTMRPNQFFTHPVCQSFCLCLFTLSPCLSLYLCFLSVHLSICLSICSRGDGHWALLWFHLLVWTCSCPPFCPSISSWLFWLSRKMDCLLFNPSHTCSEIRSDQFYHLAPFAQVRTYKIS